MKTTILIIAMTIICFTGFSSGQAYQKKMGETLQQFGEAKNLTDFQAVANQFKMIANVEKQEWLPLYYHAHIHILLSFMDQSSSEKKDEYLAVAEESLNKMMELAPQEVEIIALQSFYYTAKLVVDPMTRGMQYGMLVAQTLGKAMALDANNPRVRYLKIANDVGGASFYGVDPKQYKGAADLLLKEWDDYKVKSPLHPSWGKEQVKATLKQLSQ